MDIQFTLFSRPTNSNDLLSEKCLKSSHFDHGERERNGKSQKVIFIFSFNLDFDSISMQYVYCCCCSPVRGLIEWNREKKEIEKRKKIN
jgi:hypothetical protein